MSKWTDDQYADEKMNDLLTRSILDRYTIPDEPITALDRCDACGAQTLFRMHRPPSEEHPTRKGVLEFCGHHYRANLPELIGDGWAVAVELEIT